MNKYKYTKQSAKSYRSLGIAGTSYEVSFRAAADIIGDLTNKTVLDFGSGAGRSAKFLLSLAAASVIGLDHNETMIAEASKEKITGAKFISIKRLFPLAAESVDFAFSSSVFMEMGSLDDISQAFKEIYRVLKTGGKFVMIVTNPESVHGYKFLSYEYPDKNENVRSGDLTRVIIKTEPPFVIEDYYWELADYKRVLSAAGFITEKIYYPKPGRGSWLDEKKVTPSVVIEAVKK
jgi:toxoflavin synthase